MEVHGEGSVLASAFGDILALDVTPGEPLVVDNEHVVAWDADLDYHIEVASGMFGFTTGEGLVNTFTGAGRVYIQTRNLANLAQAMHPYLLRLRTNVGAFDIERARTIHALSGRRASVSWACDFISKPRWRITPFASIRIRDARTSQCAVLL